MPEASWRTGSSRRGAEARLHDGSWVKKLKLVSEGYVLPPDTVAKGLFLRVGVSEKDVVRLPDRQGRAGPGRARYLPRRPASRRPQARPWSARPHRQGHRAPRHGPEQLEAIAGDIADGGSATKAIEAVAADELASG